jgi:tRNA U34 2-thiouridine synthase MnmA/TrmU
MGIAPGQTAVIYEEDEVVLAGTITATRKWGENAAQS